MKVMSNEEKLNLVRVEIKSKQIIGRKFKYVQCDAEKIEQIGMHREDRQRGQAVRRQFEAP